MRIYGVSRGDDTRHEFDEQTMQKRRAMLGLADCFIDAFPMPILRIIAAGLGYAAFATGDDRDVKAFFRKRLEDNLRASSDDELRETALALLAWARSRSAEIKANLIEAGVPESEIDAPPVPEAQAFIAIPEITFQLYAPPIREASDEAALTQAFAAHLVSRGERVAVQVTCAVGIADVVTDRAVYEVKFYLTRNNVINALGQVLLYRQAINPALRAVIVGFEVPSVPLDALVHYANQLGVEVMVCNSRS